MILHVDMDAFYASVELLQRPDLKGRPVIVAGGGSRGIVLSATYEAREFGVHSAMPTGRARRLCPQAVFVTPDHRKYARVSRGVMAYFRSVTPLVQPLSLDEAFLDVSGAVRRFGTPVEIAESVRAHIRDEQGITCSVGVAPTMFVAKLASTHAKPDGLLVVRPEEIVSFLHPLPVGAFWGVGPATEEQLLRLGLKTVGDIAQVPVQTLQRAFGVKLGSRLSEMAWGRDDRAVTPSEPERSMSSEHTFGSDVDELETVVTMLLRLSDKVASRLRRADLVARTVTIKLRFSDFTTITRSHTLRESTDLASDLFQEAKRLFEALGLQRVRIRLVGLKAEGLTSREGSVQQMAFGEPEHGWSDAERAMDRVARKFGPKVTQARLIEPERKSE